VWSDLFTSCFPVKMPYIFLILHLFYLPIPLNLHDLFKVTVMEPFCLLMQLSLTLLPCAGCSKNNHENKLSPCTSSRYMVEWRYSSNYCQLGHRREVSDQLHSPTALLPEKVIVTRWIGDWVGPRASLDVWKRDNVLPLPGIKPDSSDLQGIAY